MKELDLKKLLLGTSVLAGFVAISAAAPVYAQTSDEDEEPIQVETVEEDEEGDEVVVTGSRLRKNTFNSTVPLQVITTEAANQQGLFSPTEILQTNSAASGTQIDSTFQGFVLDNGPGSETIDLRGLSADRTLVLLNSRRIAPAGVEGAPTQPSINLIPRTMVDRFDLLLDGASSVYGSDAVAGVVNVILKNDYDGLDIRIDADTPEDGAGQDYTLGGRWGIVGDRGFIGGALEYRYQDPWTVNDRDFLSGCETYREITENGEIRTVDQSDAYIAAQLGLNYTADECRPTRLTQRFLVGSAGGNRFGSVYFQPGVNNTGFGFSESGLFGVPVDGNGDGIVDVQFQNFSPNGQQGDLQQIVNEQSQISFFMNGEYTFEGEMNITPYFEVLSGKVDFSARSGQPQLFPVVPANNPFNPCNLAAGGADCNAAYNAVLANPNYQAAFQAYYNNAELSGTSNCFGLGNTPTCNPFTFGLGATPGISQTAQPVVGVLGDRNFTTAEILQTRVTTGIKGDLPGINFWTLNDWDFDAALVYSWSDSSSARSGIRSDKLNLATGISEDGTRLLTAPCADPLATPSVIAGCVPVNLFAPSLYASAAGGDFATQAERDYLFDSRDFATDISQLLLDVIVRGDIYQLPGGEVSALLGYQFRRDTLSSTPDDIARDGLFFGFFSDGGAQGSRDVSEIFGEVSIPLGTGQMGLRQLDLDIAGRITDDEFYGSNGTYSVRAGWRPVDSLLIRATQGTSFRAPNLRELFLAGQSGFNTIGDPCAVPDAAFNQLTNTYIPANDLRAPEVLQNCVREGLDPTSFLGGQFTAYSVEINSGGNTLLDPETSDSLTYGFSFKQPFTDLFDLEISATRWEIDIDDTVVSTTPGFLIASCYSDPTPATRSPLCANVVRDFTDPSNPGVIDIINSGFVNRDNEFASGYDYNFNFGKNDIIFMNRSFDTYITGQFTHLDERELTQLDAFGNADIINLEHEFSRPEWRGFVDFGFAMDRWSANWNTRYVGAVVANNEAGGESQFGNAIDGGATTCLGVSRGDVECRRVDFADDYFVHSLSARYRGDGWDVLAGVSNIFAEDPPLVDPAEVFSVNNVPIGQGYDLDGREYFIRFRKTFN